MGQTNRPTDRRLATLLTPPYMRQRPYNGTKSVRLSVPSIDRRMHAAAAGLLLWARQAGDIDRQRRVAATERRSSTAISSRCEQCHVVSRRRKLNATQTC